MKVALFVTCLVDQLCPQVGISTVEVLRRLGCEVLFDERQTCCGQPAFTPVTVKKQKSLQSGLSKSRPDRRRHYAAAYRPDENKTTAVRLEPVRRVPRGLPRQDRYSGIAAASSRRNCGWRGGRDCGRDAYQEKVRRTGRIRRVQLFMAAASVV